MWCNSRVMNLAKIRLDTVTMNTSAKTLVFKRAAKNLVKSVIANSKTLIGSLMLLLTLSIFNQALAVKPIVIKKVVDFQGDKNLIISSVSTFNLSPNVIEAINHEIPLNFKIQIELLENGSWLWFDYQRTRQSIEFHTEVRAFGVNRTYTLYNSRNNKTRSFQSIDEALQTLSTLEAFPVISLSELHPKQRYTLRMRIKLDHWKLSPPLIFEAVFSDDWNIDSGWYETTLQTPLSWQ